MVWLSVFSLVRLLFAPALLAQPATMFGIAVAHSVFNVLCTALLLPLSGMLEKLALWIVPETKKGEEQTTLLDERLLATPPLALERCHELVTRMAEDAGAALKASLETVKKFDPQAAWRIREDENRTDQYEDAVSTYLIQPERRAAESGGQRGDHRDAQVHRRFRAHRRPRRGHPEVGRGDARQGDFLLTRGRAGDGRAACARWRRF